MVRFQVLMLTLLVTMIKAKPIPPRGTTSTILSNEATPTAHAPQRSGSNETVEGVDWVAIYGAKRLASVIVVLGFTPFLLLCLIITHICNSIK